MTEPSSGPSWFERHPRRTLGLVVVGSVGLVIALDLLLALLFLPPLKGFKSGLFHHGLKANFDAVQTWHGKPYRVTTNSLGFKDDRVREVARSRGDRHRILLLGDSYTEGVGFPFGETFAGLLWDRLGRDRYEVLNAASESYSPKLYHLKLRYLLEQVRLRVDEVWVLVDISDAQDEILYEAWEPTGRSYWLEMFLLHHSLLGRFLSQRFKVENPVKGRYWRDEDTFQEERATWPTRPELQARWAAHGLAVGAVHMDALADLCATYGMKLSVVVYPWWYQVSAGERETLQTRFWGAFAARRGAGFIDLSPAFIDPARPPDLSPFLPHDGHWNERGHRLVADALYQRWLASPRR